MITGAHSIIYSTNAEADRAFLRDVLALPNVDVGHGWLIFGLPPAEVAVHPSQKNNVHEELYFMCDDINAYVGAGFSRPPPLVVQSGGISGRTSKEGGPKGPPLRSMEPRNRVYLFDAAGAAKTLAAARWVAFTHGAGQAPMPTTPTMQMRIAKPRSGDTWTRPVRTGSSMYIRRATSR